MWALDKLGYYTFYDIYDVQGYGNTNNQLGGRATVEQCTGYSIIIQDTGRGTTLNLPDGSDPGSQKIDQAQWYRDYLARGFASEARNISLWLIGENLAAEKASNPLLATDCGLASVVDDQGLNVNPDVTGLGLFTFSNGNVASFAGDVFSLNGGFRRSALTTPRCPPGPP